jgi:hypothetical protein
MALTKAILACRQHGTLSFYVSGFALCGAQNQIRAVKRAVVIRHSSFVIRL